MIDVGYQIFIKDAKNKFEIKFSGDKYYERNENVAINV